jgi:HSP20 family protein
MSHSNALTTTNGPATASAVVFTPRVDVFETEDALLLYADVPGVRPDDVDVRFERGELTLHGRCAPPAVDAERVWTEYGVGDYHRAFTIHEQVDAANITAELKHGVLTVRLPKAESVKPKKITVKGP